MIRALFSLFEITESQMTSAAIGRLKWASIIGLFFPAMIYLIETRYTGQGITGIWILVAIGTFTSMVGWLYLAMARPVNRLFIPDQYLDESEIARKREVNSFVFWWFATFVLIASLVLVLFSQLGYRFSVNITSGPDLALAMILGLLPLMCLQGLKLASIMKPYDPEGSEPASEREAAKTKDRTYYVSGFLFIATVSIIVALMR